MKTVHGFSWVSYNLDNISYITYISRVYTHNNTLCFCLYRLISDFSGWQASSRRSHKLWKSLQIIRYIDIYMCVCTHHSFINWYTFVICITIKNIINLKIWFPKKAFLLCFSTNSFLCQISLVLKKLFQMQSTLQHLM